MEEYKSKVSEETRIQECSRILNKHPDRIPIIVCKDKRSTTLQDIDKHKYLVPKDMHLSQFIYVIRKRIKLKPEQALFILINQNLVPGNKQLQEIYESNKDSDGFLYMTYSSENTFG
jgi:GABA(A) receptor-associated protein